MKMILKINDYVFTATLAANSSVHALVELLKEKPVTLEMSDNGQMEKIVDLGCQLPQNNIYMNTRAGDIILFQGNTLSIYYDSNAWSLTPIARIDNVDINELRQALGKGNVQVVVTLE